MAKVSPLTPSIPSCGGILNPMRRLSKALKHVSGNSSSSSSESSDTSIHSFTLYLVRHGEASHNVKEKAAKQRELEKAITEGLSPDCEETLRRMENARKAVLQDDNLFDAPLSEQGLHDACAAKQRIDELVEKHHLPPPTEVLVSPLTRTLETANLAFPDSNNIRVREELRERCTGKPPDTRSPSSILRSRPAFRRFSMNRLANQSGTELDKLIENSLDDDSSASSEILASACSRQSSLSSENCSEEDKEMLRVRTKKLFDLLAESTENSIAIVTHKGYLRELERGPFGNPASKEFKNGEIRVYNIEITSHGGQEENKLHHLQRLA